nr:trigger factor-like [Aegilops tauschii subsp. strangulata]
MAEEGGDEDDEDDEEGGDEEDEEGGDEDDEDDKEGGDEDDEDDQEGNDEVDEDDEEGVMRKKRTTRSGTAILDSIQDEAYVESNRHFLREEQAKTDVLFDELDVEQEAEADDVDVRMEIVDISDDGE